MPSEKWTIKSPLSGEVIAEFIVEASPVSDTQPTTPTAKENGRPASTTAEKMTEPQRRYLFRLLAAQKVTGPAAEKHLKEYFQVRALGEITKAAASAYIESLKKDHEDATA